MNAERVTFYVDGDEPEFDAVEGDEIEIQGYRGKVTQSLLCSSRHAARFGGKQGHMRRLEIQPNDAE